MYFKINLDYSQRYGFENTQMRRAQFGPDAEGTGLGEEQSNRVRDDGRIE